MTGVTNPIDEREARVEARVQAIREHQDFPALTEQMREVVRASEDEDAALDRLAALVLRNYGLTLKVLRTVNSVHYNRSGQTILSVTRAVVLLGVRAVRELAASFLLFDHYQKQSPALRQLMMLSMATASHAESLSRWAKGVSPDEACVCGMFRNLGEVMIAHHFQDDYSRIGAAVAAGSEPDEATLAVLGFRYEALGAAVAQYWGLPVVGQALVGSGSAIRAVTEFGHALTNATYRPGSGGEDVARVLSRFRGQVPVPREALDALVSTTAGELRALFSRMGASPDELAFLDGSAPAADQPAADDGTFGSTSIRETRERLLAEVVSLAGQPKLDLHRTIVAALEALQRGGPFDRALFCLVDDARSDVRARLAVGEGSEALAGVFRLPVGGRQNTVAVALADREPAFVARPDFGPGDLAVARVTLADEFGVLPLALEGRVLGCLYFDRRQARTGADPSGMIFLGRIQSLAEGAIARSRETAEPTDQEAVAISAD